MPNKVIPLTILLQAFPGIPPAEAQELVDSGQVRTYPPNTILTVEDAYEFTFYIILQGDVRVTKVIAHDQVRLLKLLGEGDFFGEMALIQDAPRAASVTTITQTTVLEIYKDAFNKLLSESASLSLAIVKEVSRRLRENDAMAIEDLRMKAGELAIAYQQLAEQEYARREFLTTIAHELRTPLTAANGFLQMIQMGLLQGEGLGTETQKNALNSVSRNIQQIVLLVNDLLFLQEMDLILPNFKPVNLSIILKNVIDQHHQKAAENLVDLKLEIEDGMPLVQGDAKSLERAFSAILDNAIKFSPDGGSVQVRVWKEKDQVVIETLDHGLGMPPEIIPRIFDRFFHIDQIEGRMFRGVGLGLSIARHVILQHGGHIEVESGLGKGTRLTVYLNPA
jgi:signal transduction histidine kinase